MRPMAAPCAIAPAFRNGRLCWENPSSAYIGPSLSTDSSILRLQKQGYITISDFTHAKDKQGNEYGWGIAEYSTPEQFWGDEFTNEVYKRTPEESLERLVEHLKTILPGIPEEQIRKIIRR